MAKYHHEALAFASQGNWEASHSVIQQFDDAFSRLIHAYLHRVEGDLSNARYWYNLAGESMPEGSVEDELQSLMAKAGPA